MAKGRKSKNNRFNSPTQRINFPNTNPHGLLGGILQRSRRQLALDLSRLNGQDLRAYNPTIRQHKNLISPAPRTVRGFPASTTIQKNRPLMKAQMQFTLPKEVTTCVRRGVRKEVLFALNKTGAGSRSKNRRFNSHSKVKC